MLAQQVGARRALDVLHDDVVAVARLVLARVEDLHDVRVLEPGGGERLAAEAGDEGLVLGQVLGQQLDRHRPLEHLVGGQEDGGHAAGAEAALEPVAAGDLAGRASFVTSRRGQPPPPVPPPPGSVPPSPLARRRVSPVCSGWPGGSSSSVPSSSGTVSRCRSASPRGRSRSSSVSVSSGVVSVSARRARRTPRRTSSLEAVDALAPARRGTSASTSSRHRSDRRLERRRTCRSASSLMSSHAPSTEPSSIWRLDVVELRARSPRRDACGIGSPSSSEPQPASASAAARTRSAVAASRVIGPRRGGRRGSRAARPPRSPRRVVDRVLDPPPGRGPGLGVEQQPGGARVAVARLADAAGVEQPAPLGEVGLVAARAPARRRTRSPSPWKKSATCEWPTAPMRGAICSMQSSACIVESTYSQTGSRGLAW